MKALVSKFQLVVCLFFISSFVFAQDFQGKAYYFSKSSLELGSWGSRMTDAQKQQVKERLKNRLQKTYILTFNREESVFNEEEKLDAISGATDSWGKAFAPGEQYKNIKSNTFIQDQEFYGKTFLVKDSIQSIAWKISDETKTIGNYKCTKATAMIPTANLSWYKFSWGELRNKKKAEDEGDNEIPMTEVTAWYSPQIPVSSGPLEYQGLPGLILEVNDGETTMLCSKLIMNPKEKIKIEAPKKGKEISKMDYKVTITKKMTEMRDMRGRRRN